MFKHKKGGKINHKNYVPTYDKIRCRPDRRRVIRKVNRKCLHLDNNQRKVLLAYDLI